MSPSLQDILAPVRVPLEPVDVPVPPAVNVVGDEDTAATAAGDDSRVSPDSVVLAVEQTPEMDKENEPPLLALAVPLSEDSDESDDDWFVPKGKQEQATVGHPAKAVPQVKKDQKSVSPTGGPPASGKPAPTTGSTAVAATTPGHSTVPWSTGPIVKKKK
ncbi:hypothetical protein C8Q76DRAFT_689906 [Earliella scabrosa]|nr:hypothetical protein C8Q76DRAFT_689906 [Earliella scabrosa]